MPSLPHLVRLSLQLPDPVERPMSEHPIPVNVIWQRLSPMTTQALTPSLYAQHTHITQDTPAA